MEYFNSLYTYIYSSASPSAESVYWCGNKRDCTLLECDMKHCIISGCEKDIKDQQRRCEDHYHSMFTCTNSPVCGFIHCNFLNCGAKSKKHNSTFCISHCERRDCSVEHCNSINCEILKHCALHCTNECPSNHCRNEQCAVIGCKQHEVDDLVKELLIENSEKDTLIKKKFVDDDDEPPAAAASSPFHLSDLD